MSRLPGKPHVQRPVSSFYDLLDASNRRTLAIERLLSANLISLEEARQRLGISPSEWTAPMQTVHLVPPEPEPPAGPPRYTGSLSVSQVRPSERPFGPGYYPEPLPWWIYWQALWIGVSAILAVGMIFHALP